MGRSGDRPHSGPAPPRTGPSPTGIDPHFNHDGNVDQDDVSAVINIVGGGGCP